MRDMAEKTGIAWTDSDVRPSTSGPKAKPPREGDKKQARQRINAEVRTGRRQHPNTLSCADCGHRYAPGERRHEYDHHRGYAAAYHYDVQPVCTLCHAKRDSFRKAKTHCVRGHEFNGPNTYLAINGTRHCRACSAIHDTTRGPRGSDYWKAVNARRSGRRG